MVERVRARVGGRISDEELLLRIMFPEEHVDALRAARDRPALSAAMPLVELVRELCVRRRYAFVSLQTDRVKVTARSR
jgi:hypothetical protein